jgi:isopentenyl-diphosphate delta-isomerase
MSAHQSHNILAGAALHRAFSVFLFTPQHELMVQRRSATKLTWPLVWTNTCCSHPNWNERGVDGSDDESLNDLSLKVDGVKQAAVRRLKDELGLELSVADLHFVTRVLYRACQDEFGEHEVDYILLAQPVQLPAYQLNEDEVAEVTIISPEQLRGWLADGTELTPWFRLISEKFLFQWWDTLRSGKIPHHDSVIHEMITKHASNE